MFRSRSTATVQPIVEHSRRPPQTDRSWHDSDSPSVDDLVGNTVISGPIRLTTVEHAAKTILLPALGRLLPVYPDITVEVILDYGLADVVADHFDALWT
jgi:DNA-binding transcriptional LysR family regulator